MGQKINPILLRLQNTNRYFDSCWYNDYFYADLISQDLKIQKYLNSILKQLQYPTGRFFIQNSQKKIQIFVFFCSPLKSRKALSNFYRLRYYKRKKKHLDFRKKGLHFKWNKEKPLEKDRGTSVLQNYSIFKNLKNYLKVDGIKSTHLKYLLFKNYLQNFYSAKKNNNQYLNNVSLNTLNDASRIGLCPNEKNFYKQSEMIPSSLFRLEIKLVHKKVKKSVVLARRLLGRNQQLSVPERLSFKNRKITTQNKGYINEVDRQKVPKNKVVNSQFLEKSDQRFQKSSQSFLRKAPVIKGTPSILERGFITGGDRMQNMLFKKVRSSSRINPWFQNLQVRKNPLISFNTDQSKSNEERFQKNLSSLFFSQIYFLNNWRALDKSQIKRIHDFTRSARENHNLYPWINKLPFRKHIESILTRQLHINVKLYWIKTNDPFRSASFLAEDIIYYLEKRIPFRRIKNKIVQDAQEIPNIKGIRITCSGRVGGRSKKAQRAKVEMIKYGQTSLHVFSSRIDFASKSALTAFGLVGIKVWICYNK